MPRYELIGKTLGHSFSKPIHEALGAYEYHLRELPDETAVEEYFALRKFDGCNVTIPYKQVALRCCDEVDGRAARIGAINTVVHKNGRLIGYNTDYDGFAYMLARKNVSLKNKQVLLLGSGGTCKTAYAVAQDAGAANILVGSRSPKQGQIAYEDAVLHKEIEIVVNVSPVGMYPHSGSSLVNPTVFPALQAVVDVVYNPLKTKLLLDAEELHIPAVGGLAMLVEQAVAAARLFTGMPFGREDTERILLQMYENFTNLVLVGMPSCGKSKLGRAVARKLDKPFVDLDTLLEERDGRSIPEIFAQEGEAGFRRIETQILLDASKHTGQVLSTGGGIVTQPHNIPLLHQNGLVVYIQRPLELLETGGDRPLSTSREALADMYHARHPLYQAAADICVENDAPFMKVVHKILEAYDAALNP